jgi:hypothetical protein
MVDLVEQRSRHRVHALRHEEDVAVDVDPPTGTGLAGGLDLVGVHRPETAEDSEERSFPCSRVQRYGKGRGKTCRGCIEGRGKRPKKRERR